MTEKVAGEKKVRSRWKGAVLLVVEDPVLAEGGKEKRGKKKGSPSLVFAKGGGLVLCRRGARTSNRHHLGPWKKQKWTKTRERSSIVLAPKEKPELTFDVQGVIHTNRRKGRWERIEAYH